MNRQALAHMLRLSALTATLCSASVAQAELLFSLELDTSSLIGHIASPFFIEFQLNDGSGAGDGNNTALLSNFAFGGGTALGSATLDGGASGDLDSHVVLAEDQFFNSFVQEFVPGTLLSFDVELSTVVDLGPQPDQFSFAILDCSGVEIPTMSPADALLAIDIDSPHPIISTYAGDASRSPACGGPPLPLDKPKVVPLPAAALLLVLALSGLGACTRRGAPRANLPGLKEPG